jgi:hypothetical protein
MQIILDPTNSADLDAAEKIVQALKAKVRRATDIPCGISVVGQPVTKVLQKNDAPRITDKVKAGVEVLTGKILYGLSRGKSSALSLRKFAKCKRKNGHCWKLAIDSLIAQGKIKKSGTGCGTTYHLTDESTYKMPLPSKLSAFGRKAFEKSMEEFADLKLELERSLNEDDERPQSFDQSIHDGVIDAIKNGVHRAQTIRARLRAKTHPWRTTVNHMLKTNEIRRVGWASGVNYYLGEVRNGITNRSKAEG